jgi:ABC-type antimicrobial peptide transport system ATPase subunit
VTLICSLISLPTTSLNPRGQISLHIYMPLLDIKTKTERNKKDKQIRLRRIQSTLLL